MLQFFLRGGPVMWPLLACSLVSLTIILERAIFWIKESRRRDVKAMHQVVHMVEHGLYDEAKTLHQKSRDYLVRIFLSSIPHHHLSLEGALEMSAVKEINRMKQYLPILDTIITVAPLLGIFGTVTGILSSFNVLGKSTGFLAPELVAKGIAEAVITTVAGLAIAIPTVVFYNYFTSKVETKLSEIDVAVTNFNIVYQKGKEKGQKHESAEVMAGC